MKKTAFILSLAMLCAISLLWAVHADKCPPQDAIDIGLGEAVTGDTPGAYYKITFDNPGQYTVNMLSVPAEMLTWIRVNGDTGNDFTAGTRTSVPGELTSLKLDITQPGIYYVGILELEGKRCGPYIFEVS